MTPLELVRRFTPAERWVHRTTAALMLVCLATAAMLYLPALAEIVGRRRLVVTVHEWTGIALPAPALLGLASRAFRGDLGLLNRFNEHDWNWLRGVLRRTPEELRPAGKFNAGQKLYASFAAGAALVMVGTGLLMWFPHLSTVVWRTGATFVHDWLALAIGGVVAGHIWMAMRDPEARLGMRTGHVSPEWARRHHPQWRHDAHLTDPAPASDPGTGTHKSSSSLRPPVPPR
ncbi:cytochrome b/b6 domain-containing protein [Actinacidiphila oryziradicis]|jgi:formate dehydrogenase subunit gamma|uniref:Formate dehydrogenase n=1 Tax=Actinacidiphila oryziradicis TaxID=2571141 RepID=A0A4U0RSH2_9ACTN|nr:cytochrome b/b6 domain-containing protein [Actinacidiphila oryziradicis]TJZ98352.1 formate dehydrogenase [Actinacidiphila oryziradicis]